MSTEIINTAQKVKGEKRHNIRRWILRLTLVLAIFAPLTFLIAATGYKVGLFDLRTSFGLLNMKLGPFLMALSVMVAMIALIPSLTLRPKTAFIVGGVFLGGVLMTYLGGVFSVHDDSLSSGLGKTMSLIGVLALLVSLIYALTVQTKRTVLIVLFAMIVPILAGLKLAKTRADVASLPYIHDITTDTQDVPKFTEAILSERAKVEGVNTVDYVGKKDKPDGKLVSVLQSQAKAYADIRPLILEDDMAVVFGRAKAAALQMGWKLKSENVETGIIEATDTTFWYGFKDDVVIRIRPSEGGGSVLDVRSVSRVGQSDIGANAARIRGFLAIMRKA